MFFEGFVIIVVRFISVWWGICTYLCVCGPMCKCVCVCVCVCVNNYTAL